MEDRFQNYERAVREFCTPVKRDTINKEYIKQVIRSGNRLFVPAGLSVPTIQKHPMILEKLMKE